MLLSHLMTDLFEAPLPSSYEAGLKRFGLSQPKQKSPLDSKQLVQQLQQMIQNGEVDKETLNNFKQMNDLLDKVLGKQNETGNQPPEKPTYSSWYGKRQQRSEQLTKNQKHERMIQAWSEKLGLLAAQNDAFRKPIQTILLRAAQAKRGEVHEQYEPKPGEPRDILNKFREVVNSLSLDDIYKISDAVQQAIKNPESVQQKKPKGVVGPSRTGVARKTRQQKLKPQDANKMKAPINTDVVGQNMKKSMGF